MILTIDIGHPDCRRPEGRPAAGAEHPSLCGWRRAGCGGGGGGVGVTLRETGIRQPDGASRGPARCLAVILFANSPLQSLLCLTSNFPCITGGKL